VDPGAVPPLGGELCWWWWWWCKAASTGVGTGGGTAVWAVADTIGQHYRLLLDPIMDLLLLV
jgi:hypothetical protein